MQRFIQVYRYINLLSIDVALGAVCSALFFARTFEVQLIPIGLTAMGLTVWIIYTTDHLLDARKVKKPASTRRHQFHQQHFNTLAGCVGLAVLLNGMAIYFIRKPVLVGGLMLITGVGLYLIVQQYMKFLKETVIALMYTLGVLLPSLVMTPIPYHDWPWVLLVQFFLTALLNLLIFSWFDREHDTADNANSFVTVMGERKSVRVIQILFLLVLALTFFSTKTLASGFILLSNVFLLVIFIRQRYFRTSDRFRLVGDAVFFILILYLFV